MPSRAPASNSLHNGAQPSAENNDRHQGTAPDTRSLSGEAPSTPNTSATTTTTTTAAGEGISYYQNFIEQLLHLIAHGNEEAVSRILSVIRSGASYDEILGAVAELPRRENGSSSSAPDSGLPH